MVCLIPMYLCLRPLKRASFLVHYRYVATRPISTFGLYTTHRPNSYPRYFVHTRYWPMHLKLLASAVMHLNTGNGLSTKIVCWKCGLSQQNEVSNLFCDECNALQLPNTKLDYFNIIGVEKNYDINIATMTRKYYQLQNILHPDRFSNKPAEEQKISEDFSSLVNKAYFTLLNPLSRGLYLLELQGVFIEEGKTQSSPEFLMEIMERNEDVDQAQDATQMRELSEKNKHSLDKLTQEASQAFKSGDIKKAEEILIKMKYYSSIDAKIKDMKQKNSVAD